MKSSIPKKFMSIRDKNGHHRRSKSSEPGHKSRTLSADMFFSYFKSDASKQAAKDEEEKEKLALKVEDIYARVQELSFHNITREHIRFALLSRYSDGDTDKAIELIRLQQQAFSGIVVPYNPNMVMLGAENRSNVTCYLDALLFAMFAKLGAFECMLKTDLPTEDQRNLAALIRLWVNMLRSGKLIRTDMTAKMQEALAACGWKDARLLEQQDTSEAFAFITETLQLPLLTLQVDLFHQGRRDADDHKVVYERLLNLAVPPDPEGKGVKLEDCLEEYFNTQVDVLRDSLVEKNAGSPSRTASLATESTIRPVPAEEAENTDSGYNNADNQAASSSTGPSSTQKGVDAESADQTPAPVRRRWTMYEPSDILSEDSASPSADGSQLPPPLRQRSTSIIQRIIIEDGRPSRQSINPNLLQQFKKQGSTIIKAVTIPAWQFFRLVPWHSASNSEPQNDVEVARQFSQRPVVGICLKRYMMDQYGRFLRQNTYIDIPDSLRLPSFMMDESGRQQEGGELSADYKLVLQSVVCHRGLSLHSGHYISFARVNPKLLTENRREQVDPPPDYEEEQWVRFDDLAIENRVAYVDDIRAALKAEMPYLLFYQIVPMVDSPSSTDLNKVPDPPSYNDSTSTVAKAPRSSAPSEARTSVDVPRPETKNSNGSSSFVDVSTSTINASTAPSTAATPNIRLSVDYDRSQRVSFEEDLYSSTAGPYRRFGEEASRRSSLWGASAPVTPEGGRSPIMQPTTAVTPVPSDEPSTAQRLSRAAARLTGKSASRSRPPSQTGETRMSMTMSRLSGLMTRASREPLRQSEEGGELPPLHSEPSVSTIAMGSLPSAKSANLTALDPGTSLTNVLSTPMANRVSMDQPPKSRPSLDVPTALAGQQQAENDKAAIQQHSHNPLHRHHHHLRHGKSKSRSDKDEDGFASHATLDATDHTSSSGKGKEKERLRGRNGVPERECSVM